MQPISLLRFLSDKKMSQCAESWLDGRPQFRRKSPVIVVKEGALSAASGSRQHNATSPCHLWSRTRFNFSGNSWHFLATFERGFVSSAGRFQGARSFGKPSGSSGMVLARPGAFRCAELASADGSSSRCRGPVMRVDRVPDVSAVATRGARMMPGAFEDAEDGTLRARDIFVRELPSSNVACHLRRGRPAMKTGVGSKPLLNGSTAASAGRNSPLASTMHRHAARITAPEPMKMYGAGRRRTIRFYFLSSSFFLARPASGTRESVDTQSSGDMPSPFRGCRPDGRFATNHEPTSTRLQ